MAKHFLTTEDVGKLRRTVNRSDNAYLRTPGQGRRRHVSSDRQFPIHFQNKFGSDVEPYAIMDVTGSVEYEGYLLLEIGRPSTSFKRIYLINGPRDVEDQKRGWGTFAISRPAKALYDSSGTLPSLGQSWGAKHDEWKLFPNRQGFHIWGARDETDGYVWVTQEPITRVIGVTDAELEAGLVADINIHVGPSGAEIDSTLNLSNRDWMLKSGKSISSGKKVVCEYINGVWYVGAAECE